MHFRVSTSHDHCSSFPPYLPMQTSALDRRRSLTRPALTHAALTRRAATRGFTMMELLVVLAILGLLAGLAISIVIR